MKIHTRLALNFCCTFLTICGTVHGTTYSDGFEAPVIDPYWTTSATNATVGLISTNVHSGLQSLELATSNAAASKGAQAAHHFSSPTYGTASVWVRDAAADDISGNYIQFYLYNSVLATRAGLFTQDFDLGPTNGGNYYYDAFSAASSTASSVDRTKDWHFFEITSLADQLELSIDGSTVYSGPTGSPFDRVIMEVHAPGFRPGLAVQYDDFHVAHVPAPVYYYPFDGHALDLAGGHDGTLVGDATFSNDVPTILGTGQSLELDGTLDKVIYDTGAGDSVREKYTVAAWVKALERRPESTLAFVGTRSPEDHGTDFKYLADRSIRLDIGNGANWLTISDTPVSYALDEWHHVAVTVEPGQYKLYYDGQLINTVGLAAGDPVLIDADHDLAIGAVGAYGFSHPEDFYGRIDDVRIYNRVLTASEVQLAKVAYFYSIILVLEDFGI